jgi:integrase
MASIIKRCDCDGRGECPHPWVVRCRTAARAVLRRRPARDRGLPAQGRARQEGPRLHRPQCRTGTFRAEAEAWLNHHLGTDSTIVGYRSVLRWHVYPAIGDRQIRAIRREDIKEIVATMTRKGLSASRISQAHLVINAVFNETVRNKKLAESPCTDIPVPVIARAADFVFPVDDQVDALAAGLPADWAATIWLMYGCGLRIGEALAVRTRRINWDSTLRVREQVNPVAQLRPLKFRVAGQFRDIPLPAYVAEAIDKHIASHGTTPDGYLFQGRMHKLVIRRTYQEDFLRSAARAGLPPEFTPHRGTATHPSPWPRGSPSLRSRAGSGTRASRSPTRPTAISSPPHGTGPGRYSTTRTGRTSARQLATRPKTRAESVLIPPGNAGR